MTYQFSIEQIKVTGEDLLEQVERIVQEGNARRIVIKHDGRIVAEFPLTAGVIGTALAPMLTAIGALAAALTHCTIEVERVDWSDDNPDMNELANQECLHEQIDETVSGDPVPH